MTVCIVSLHLQCPTSPKKAQVVNFLDFYSALPNAAQNGDIFFYAHLSVWNQNYTTEFAVACRKKYFCLPSRPRSKAECCSFGCRRQFTAVLPFRVVSARAKERKGQTPESVFTFPHSDEEVASSYFLPSEQGPISQTEPPDTL